MNYANYFPEQRQMLMNVTVRRERLLPDGNVGDVLVKRGSRVSAFDVIAQGVSKAPYHWLDAAAVLRVRTDDDLSAALQVFEGETVAKGEPIAARGRSRKLIAPMDCVLIRVESGRILVREVANPVIVEAGMNGIVVEIRPNRGAVIETIGAVLQGAWGNGGRGIGVLRLEPDEGIETIRGSVIDDYYRGTLVVTRKPLTARAIDVMRDQAISGVIAPSMSPRLLPEALAYEGAILLINGFGDARMNPSVESFLRPLEGRQGAIEASAVDSLRAARPEMILNVPSEAGVRPPVPRTDIVLQPGRSVRLTRGRGIGSTGQILNLPKSPILLENGLQVSCAEVELVTGERLMVPLANIEVSGA